MTELDALEQLSNLLMKIEENNWDGIFKKIDMEHGLPFTPRTYRQEKEILKLKEEKNATEFENKTLRIKLQAVKNLVDGNKS